MRRFTFRVQSGERKHYGLAIAAGLLLAAAFPKLGVAGFAWLAPGLLFMAAIGYSGAAAFRIGYVGGLAFYLASLSWLLHIPIVFAPIVGWLSLAAYLAVYPGVWVWLCWKLYPAQAGLEHRSPTRRVSGVEDRAGSETGAPIQGHIARPNGPVGSLTELLDQFLSTPWLQRLGWGFCGAALWVGLEMIVGRLFSGFPWLFLGVSQYRILPVIQVASITGVYGVSFLAVWFSLALVSTLAMLLRRPQVRWHAQRELVVPFVVTAAVVAAGWWTLMRPSPELRVPSSKSVKVALIQPSIPQTWIWDSKESSNRFQQLLTLTEQALTNQPDLLVWPEAAVPSMYRFDEQIYTAVTNIVQKHKVWLVLGSDDGEGRALPDGRMEFSDYFNSSFLVSPEGETMGRYHKRQLVIFGEYIPFGRRFSFIEKVTGMGSFTRGDRPAIFSMPALHAKAAIVICFEDVFPHLTRDSVDDDTDFILNLTNNGWFGESAAQWQHAANAVFRAIENGLPEVRCANNGLTCWVDAQGRMNDIFFAGTHGVYGVGYKIIDVPLLDGHQRKPTFYHQHGDWFGWGCLGLSTGAILWPFFRRRSLRQS